MVSDVLSVYSAYILPMMFGLLGTIIAAIRKIQDQVGKSELHPRDFLLTALLVPMGAVAAVAVGLFFSPSGAGLAGEEKLSGNLSLTAGGIGFLAGYGSPAFFSLMDDLLKQVSLEERIYRHRCVETWAMTVPWIGFPLADLVKLAEPLGSAKYVVFTTVADEKTMPGLHASFYPWPYTEGVTMEEAMNELAFLSVGMYGKTLPPQNGAPIRLTLPWKYGFKSAKSIVKISFTDKRPTTFWQALQDEEYGFWANVNPGVPHPRWSQARERLLGNDEMVATQIWNGYGEQVAAMYANMKGERLFV